MTAMLTIFKVHVIVDLYLCFLSLNDHPLTKRQIADLYQSKFH